MPAGKLLGTHGNTRLTYGALLGAANSAVLEAAIGFGLLVSFFLAPPDFAGASSPESSRAAKKFAD